MPVLDCDYCGKNPQDVKLVICSVSENNRDSRICNECIVKVAMVLIDHSKAENITAAQLLQYADVTNEQLQQLTADDFLKRLLLSIDELFQIQMKPEVS